MSKESSQLKSVRSTLIQHDHELELFTSKFDEEKLERVGLEQNHLEITDAFSRSQSYRDELQERLAETQKLSLQIESQLEKIRTGTRNAEEGGELLVK